MAAVANPNPDPSGGKLITANITSKERRLELSKTKTKVVMGVDSADGMVKKMTISTDSDGNAIRKHEGELEGNAFRNKLNRKDSKMPLGTSNMDSLHLHSFRL